jgi:hypothetical protein
MCRRRPQYTRCQTRSTEAKIERPKYQILRFKEQTRREKKLVYNALLQRAMRSKMVGGLPG